MTSRDLAIMIKDILDEYRVLESSPLQSIKLVKVDENNVLLFSPYIVIEMDDGCEFKISVISK